MTTTNRHGAVRILTSETSHDELTAAVQAIGLVLLNIHRALQQAIEILTDLTAETDPAPHSQPGCASVPAERGNTPQNRKDHP